MGDGYCGRLSPPHNSSACNCETLSDSLESTLCAGERCRDTCCFGTWRRTAAAEWAVASCSKIPAVVDCLNAAVASFAMRIIGPGTLLGGDEQM